MRQLMQWCIYSVLLLASMAIAGTQDYRQVDVDRLLKAVEEPAGVVFELLAPDDNTWTWAAPMLGNLRKQLQQRFPDIDVVVVSHGAEQFQLTKDNAQDQPDAIAALSSLVNDGVNLHVCGTHSSWQGVEESAYLDIVDVSPSGPAQINDYIKLGYEHILLQKPE